MLTYIWRKKKRKQEVKLWHNLFFVAARSSSEAEEKQGSRIWSWRLRWGQPKKRKKNVTLDTGFLKPAWILIDGSDSNALALARKSRTFFFVAHFSCGKTQKEKKSVLGEKDETVTVGVIDVRETCLCFKGGKTRNEHVAANIDRTFAGSILRKKKRRCCFKDQLKVEHGNKKVNITGFFWLLCALYLPPLLPHKPGQLRIVTGRLFVLLAKTQTGDPGSNSLKKKKEPLGFARKQAVTVKKKKLAVAHKRSGDKTSNRKKTIETKRTKKR